MSSLALNAVVWRSHSYILLLSAASARQAALELGRKPEGLRVRGLMGVCERDGIDAINDREICLFKKRCL